MQTFLLASAFDPVGTPAPLGTPVTEAGLGTTLGNFLSALLVLAGVAAVLYLVFAGIRYISSGGDPAKVKTARAALVNAVIGVVVIVAAYGLINFSLRIGTSIVHELNK